jgi:carboxymethylenebutenolidase
VGAGGQVVTFSSGPDRVKGHLERPAGPGPFPVLVVVHEIHGLTEHIRDVARRFAAEGYVGLALDLYSREGPPQRQALRDAAARNAFVASLPDRRVVGDVQAAAAFLQTRPEVRRDRVGVVGFCMGGTVTLLSACHTPDLAAAVVFYGGRLIYKEITETKPAPHAFFNDAREFYGPDEARDAWQRTLTFLEKHLRH